MSRRYAPLGGGEGIYWALVGIWCILRGLAKGGVWLFRLGMDHAVSEPSGPPMRYIPRARSTPSFDDYASDFDAPEEPSVTEPFITLTTHEYLAADDVLDEPPEELLLRSEDAPLSLDPPPEPRQYDIVRTADGTIMLRYRANSLSPVEVRPGEDVLNLPEPKRARAKEPSSYHRKLIPPGSCNRDD